MLELLNQLDGFDSRGDVKVTKKKTSIKEKIIDEIFDLGDHGDESYRQFRSSADSTWSN